MKKNEKKQEGLPSLKKRLSSATVMLLIAAILLTTTSYAWFVLSTAPEVTGIQTQVGSNGSLEIALLTTDTRKDPSKIPSGGGIGNSLEMNGIYANHAWGNLIDLSYQEYGLGDIILLPARLNLSGDAATGYAVDASKLLKIPTYGYDGRVKDLTDNTLSAINGLNGFTYLTGVQDYGVRAVGRSDFVSVQQSALNTAKGNIPTYTQSANSNAQNVLTNNGDVIFGIMMKYMNEENYNNEDRDNLNSLLLQLENSVNSIDAALRQGIVAYAASQLSGEDLFESAKDEIMDPAKTISTLLEELPEGVNVPDTFETWADKLATMQNDLNAAKALCMELADDDHTWDEISDILDYVMNVNRVYIDDSLFNVYRTDEAARDALVQKVLNGQQITMTLAPNSGIFADIADFTGNYNTAIRVMGQADMKIETLSTVEPKYLEALKTGVDTLNAAGGGAAATEVPLTSTFGYALDLAFRCNADNPDLLLQTEQAQRVYDGSDSYNTLGGGSSMAFYEDMLEPNQREALMDAMRVGFLDEQGNLLGVARLNLSNQVSKNGMTEAPLYLYDFHFDENTGAMIMDERQKENNLLTDAMQKYTVKMLTVVVWLDGDLVDNSMVSATEAASLSGLLNLQFSTSADLIPADNPLKDGEVNTETLAAEILRATATLNEGQLTWTNASWNEFVTALNRANIVAADVEATTAELYSAYIELNQARSNLTPVSVAALSEKAEQIRTKMGKNEGEIAGYVIENADGSYSFVGNEDHTQQEHDSWVIKQTLYRVDYNKNLHDEGHEIYTQIYTDAAWDALAVALYQAEFVALNPVSADDEISGALTALETAEKALTRQVFYTPYTYEGSVYYEAICDAENVDTYGKWYDSNFQRVVSDLMILKLDAYATPWTNGNIGISDYIDSDPNYWPERPLIQGLAYPGYNIKGAHWSFDDAFFTEMMNGRHYEALSNLVTIAATDEVLNFAPSVELAEAQLAAEELMDRYNDNDYDTQRVTVAEVQEVTSNLNNIIVQVYAENTALMASLDPSMTENQRILLTAAVNAGNSVELDATDPKLAQLQFAVDTAEGVLADPNATKEAANNALTALNDALDAVGEEKITEYNTITHKLPEGFGADDLVYIDDTYINLMLTGKSGTTTLKVTVLTQEGVVYNLSKEVLIYDRPDNWEVETGSYTSALTEGETSQASAYLEYEEGGNHTGDKPLGELVRERVSTITWSSEDTDVLTVDENGLITAVGEGQTDVIAYIQTVEGNGYVCRQTVRVTPAADPEPTP